MRINGSPSPRMSQSGQAMLAAIVGSFIGALTLGILGKATVSQMQAARGISSTLEMNDISVLVHLLTDKQSNCRATGLTGLNLTSLFAPSPSPVPFALGPSNGQPPLLQKDVIFGGVRKISSIAMTKAVLLSGTSYLATLEIQTTLIGKATTSASSNLSFFINVELNASKVLTDCWGGMSESLASATWIRIPSGGGNQYSNNWLYPVNSGITTPRAYCISQGFSNSTGKCRFSTTFSAEGVIASNTTAGSWAWSCMYGNGAFYANPANTDIECSL